MPLKIVLKVGEKVIINGAVLENVGGVMKALLLNEASVLREKDIVTEKDASTPASRAYYALQNLYLFPQRAGVYAPLVKKLFSEYAAAAPSAEPLISDILRKVEEGKLYPALRDAQKLIEHEGSVMDHVEQDVSTALLDDAEGRGSKTD